MNDHPQRIVLLLPKLSFGRRLKFTFVSLAIVFTATVSSAAQTAENLTASSTETQGIEKGWNEFGIWGGISFHSPTWIGQTPDVRFGNIGLRYGRVLAASKSVAFEYTIDAVPVAILSTRDSVICPLIQRCPPFRVRESVYGAGLSPIGLKFNFRRQRRFQPFAAATGGFLYFQRDVPFSGAAQFNYTFDFAGGIQIVNSNRRSFTIGYKYQHISNGDRSPINPGVDVQMVYVGYSIFK